MSSQDKHYTFIYEEANLFVIGSNNDYQNILQ